MTGEDTIITIESGDKQIIIKEDPAFTGKIDEMVHFDLSDCHFFESESGNRIDNITE